MRIEQQTKADNPVWDIAKLVMAFLVVGVHVFVQLDDPSVVFFQREWLGRFPVPMFFCLAGFFLFQKTQPTERLVPPDTDTVKRYFLRILRMYVLWSFVYLLPTFVRWIRTTPTIRDVLILVEHSVICGSSYLHLWYLSALFTAVFLIWATHRFLSLRKVFLLAFLLFVIGLLWMPHYYLVRGMVDGSALLSELHTQMNRYLGWPRNGVFFAFVFVSLGALLGKQQLQPIRGKKAWPLFVLFAALSFLEVWWIRATHDGSNTGYCALQLSLLPATYALFSALRQIRMQPRPVYRTLRKCSTLIYCLHPMVMNCLHPLQSIDAVDSFFSLPFVKWIVVYLLAFAAALGWVRLERCRPFRFLRVMH